MMNTFFRPLYNHLENQQDNNVYDNLNHDDDYLKASKAEREICMEHESLDLSKKQKEEFIDQWFSTIHAKDTSHTMVIFHMSMQCCFSSLVHLVNLK